MRTTIRLDNQLLAETKQLAAQSGRTVTAVVEDALREMLARRRRTVKRVTVSLKTASGCGLLPGIDLDGSAALLDVMAEADGPAGR